MNPFNPIAVACAAIACFAVLPAHADPLINARAAATQTAQGGLAGRSGLAIQGNNGGTAGGRRGVVTDGQGNASGAAGSGFTTASGGQGLRSAKFNRSADGSVNASGQASASGQNGSADRSSSFTRNADGTASGERSTTATNANTGVTFDGSTSYTKGSGVSRSASCTDAAGNSVACLSR